MNEQSKRNFKIGVIAILHESNTFIDSPTELKHFQQNILCDGEDVLLAFRDSNHEVGGFLDVLDPSNECTPVGVFAARAMPYGTITAECWNQLIAKMESAIKQTTDIDAWLVAPHGATVAENALDADGDWLSRLRHLIGPDVLIIGTLDLHANVSPLMIQSCDALLSYKTNPHLDQRIRGAQAAQLLLRALRGEVRPVSTLVQLPMMVNIERQATGESQGTRLLEFESKWRADQPKLLDVSFIYGFPYSDVEEMGGSLIVVVDGDQSLADSIALDLAQSWWQDRESFRGQLISISNAVERALASGVEACVGLLDMGDNIGGGSPGDSTWIAHELLRRKCLPAFVWLCDLESVEQANHIGVGATAHFSIGGKSDKRQGPPIVGDFRVQWLGPGVFTEGQTRHGGYSRFDQGETAILTNQVGLTVMIAKQRVAPMSLSQMMAFGLDPKAFRTIVIKGVHAPVAAYQPVCTHLIRVNSSGVTTADDSALVYLRRRVPMFPWE